MAAGRKAVRKKSTNGRRKRVARHVKSQYPRWRMKQHVGTHRFVREAVRKEFGLPVVVEPGMVIQCPRLCIGAAADKFVQLTPDPPEDVGPEPVTGLRVEHVGGGYYNVVNEGTGRPINGKKLTRGEARDLARLAGPPTADQTPEARAEAEDELEGELVEAEDEDDDNDDAEERTRSAGQQDLENP